MKSDVPYQEKKINNITYQRIFQSTVDTDEIIWHKDKEDRIVEVIKNDGNWLFQYDDSLPQLLQGTLLVPKEKYHRTIKGDGDLIVNITKLS
jgi:hypothetical protein